ncbi:MAG: ankyrin repeat domain-containing protein, partial [Solirubrobacteraceae bacterium]
YLIVWAAAQRRLEAVRTLIELGWDVNAFGRGDVPSGTKWQTALHQAAGDGDLDLIRLLLGSGADPNLPDHRFSGTPVQWAAHFGHHAAIELLAPLTEPDLDPGPA